MNTDRLPVDNDQGFLSCPKAANRISARTEDNSSASSDYDPSARPEYNTSARSNHNQSTRSEHDPSASQITIHLRDQIQYAVSNGKAGGARVPVSNGFSQMQLI
jgi:hypothetical protein